MPSRIGSAKVHVGEATETKEETPIVKEGYLWKRGEYIRNWRARYYILRADGSFLGFKSRAESQHAEEKQNDFMLQEDVTIVTEEKPKPNTFTVKGVILRGVPVDRTYHVENPADREAWINVIKAVVESLRSGKQSHSKQIGEREMSMYDVSLLNSLNKTKHDLPTNWTVRPLQLSDYNKGFLELLSQQSDVGNISKSEFSGLFHKMASPPPRYYVTVVENTSSNRIIATATLVTEFQFNHSNHMTGWVKDFVIDDLEDKKQLKNILSNMLTELGEKSGHIRINSTNV
uniref:Glucosamine 6-phosphate N-acetyltransferase n=1 Tax=Crassostrea virginica TaxID=6565 RepID=A0A8B8DV97_CRAVI|nr:RAC-beta serine/threonine-protein kinase-like [Crassostrea virginica]XP_022331579.1 RAC-beta serine/threonine-protein kinase-like [Crassostrea virginica]XP_022331580.1 RAC-beta serine/threonine-protein kinase-like [Crassostrea virginica]